MNPIIDPRLRQHEDIAEGLAQANELLQSYESSALLFEPVEAEWELGESEDEIRLRLRDWAGSVTMSVQPEWFREPREIPTTLNRLWNGLLGKRSRKLVERLVRSLDSENQEEGSLT